jgi:hypothetical protein
MCHAYHCVCLESIESYDFSLKVKRLIKREITVLYISWSGLTCITALAKDQWVQKVVQMHRQSTPPQIA